MSRASRAEWAKRVERWQDSGLTAKEFASELSVSPNSLTFWKWKLKQTDPTTTLSSQNKARQRELAAPAPRFVQLLAASSAASTMSGLEVVLACGLTVRVPKDFDEATLSRLVAALGAQR